MLKRATSATISVIISRAAALNNRRLSWLLEKHGWRNIYYCKLAPRFGDNLIRNLLIIPDAPSL